jgi:IS5 family transposase
MQTEIRIGNCRFPVDDPRNLADSMKPQTPDTTAQDDLFRHRLDNIISMQHALVRLTERIDWDGMNRLLGDYYEDAVVGQPPKPTRLMAGLLYLKHTFALSDEELIARWVENAYWQYFCGETYFQHEPPIHPTSLTRYRQRLGQAGCEELLQLTIEAGVAERVIDQRDMAEVLVDTTVMEKAITYPTDSKLYLKSLLRLNREAKAHGIVLRQSYTRTAKRLAIKASRYAHARQYRRMRKVLKQLKGRLGRVVRDIERKIADWPSVPNVLAHELTLAKRLLAQQPKGRNKLYSLHAPEVECISKGKAHKRYEFGVKVGVVASLRTPFILAAHSLPGNPYDGHTLAWSLAHTKLNTGVPIKTAVVDKGYRGPRAAWPGVEVVIPGQRSRDESHRQRRRKQLRRRSVIEALIGHMKTDGLLDRNWLKGSTGDAIHVVLCAAGQNLRLILRAIEAFFARYILGLQAQLPRHGAPPRLWGLDSFQCDTKIMLLPVPRNKSGNHSCFGPTA